MSASRSAVVVALCGALDGVLGQQLVTRELAAWSLLALLGAHVALSLAFGLALPGALPPFIRAERREIVGCGALIALCIPALGSLGMLVVARLGLTRPREEGREAWVAFERDDSVDVHQRRPLRARAAAVSATEIRAALEQRGEGCVARRFQSVLAIRRLPPRVGVPLLKIAQSDPADEIRLYAFSRLERMRDQLERQVKEVTSSLETARDADGARLHLRLAQSYWELGYLGLAEGAVLAHALKSAHEHAAIACEQSPLHAPAEFFRGRVLLHLREPDRASNAFACAMRAGYPRVKVLPWLAECAFYERDFPAVAALLGELEALSPENVFFQAVSDLWVARGAGRPWPRGSRESLRIGSERKLHRVQARDGRAPRSVT